ncbi:MAG: integrase [Clostridiales bacterium]|nr:integrase [Clostridiales bacterium]
MIEDYNRSWYGQRQGYEPGLPGAQRTPYSGMSQAESSIGGVGGLSREERQEAKRLAEEAGFSFSGYQVVRREFISHRFDPAMTIRGNSITFNNSCISKLEDATYIQFLINPEEHKLAIRPCDEGARDAVRWCVVRGDKRKSREITCRPFTTKLYELMGWETIYRYKLQGMKINYQGENLYLFDLSSKEAFLPQSRDPETGKIKRPKPILPREWMETFGMDVDAHTASTHIDLKEGFVSSDMSPAEKYDEKEMTEVIE